MKTEFEATFVNIFRSSLTDSLRQAGAKRMRPEYLQRRVILQLPKEKRADDIWLRVRDEGDKVTLTLKSIDGKTIAGQREILLIVNDFTETVALLESIGCEKISYQESKRELWVLDNVEIAIDTWPFLEPYVEVEGPSEAAVKGVVEKLNLNYAEAIFDTVNAIYKKKYGKTIEELDQAIVKNFVFSMKNPFLKEH